MANISSWGKYVLRRDWGELGCSNYVCWATPENIKERKEENREEFQEGMKSETLCSLEGVSRIS